MIGAIRSWIRLYWPMFSWEFYDWLTSPKRITLALLIFIGVCCLIRSPRLRRRLVHFGWILLVSYWFLISPLFAIPANALLTRLVPEDAGRPADAIVVLTRGKDIQGQRYQTAVTMVANGRAPRIFTHDRHRLIDVYERLQRQGLSPEALLGTVCARTTQTEAAAATAILRSRGVDEIVLITDAPHMLRSWLTFRGFGFTVTPHIEPLPDQLSYVKRSFLAIREYLGLLSYWLLGRLQEPSPEAIDQLIQAATQAFPPENCGVTADQVRQWIS